MKFKRKPITLPTPAERRRTLDRIADSERDMLPNGIDIDLQHLEGRESSAAVARRVTRADPRSASPYRPSRAEKLVDYLLATGIGALLAYIIFTSLS